MTLRWGIVGLGRAGRSRAAAIVADLRCEWVGAWRGAEPQPPARGYSSFEALLDAVDAVAICSPNDVHAAQVRAALTAGRHVVCEFPLAGSAAEAQALFELAETQGRRLHVEHIEILTATAAAVRSFMAEGGLQGGSLAFSSPDRGWIGDPDRALAITHRNIARLHRLLDALGPPERLLVHERRPTRLSATLWFQGAPVQLTLHHAPDAPRSLTIQLTRADGQNLRQRNDQIEVNGAPVALPSDGGLFQRDHDAFMAALLHDAPLYVPSERALELLHLADGLLAAQPAREIPHTTLMDGRRVSH
jgi:biliverdin reductase